MNWCWHSRISIRVMGKYRYEECVKCSKRRAIDIAPGLYGPIDQKWIDSASEDK